MIRINNSACQYPVHKDNIPVSVLWGIFYCGKIYKRKIDHFKHFQVDNSVEFITFTMLCYDSTSKCYATIATILLFHYPKPSK